MLDIEKLPENLRAGAKTRRAVHGSSRETGLSNGAGFARERLASVLNAKFVRFRASHFHELRIHKAH
ncbi:MULTISPECIES: hypothetical protein [Bradyrhizobium]|uniref:hypothetical protein n=1 Tax=Bradyrhizobium TaxID=374 RepID=UPI00114492DE|nr:MULTISPECIES: hypothetical protein [Bradyrhizobium]MCP1846567.1 hypothetical protein [Bradyrhizobium sp. USDA 4541]MCP1910554.1 hypothetical protein [Bradyrhizobium elkanii]